jgi:calcium-dependent protein kinase
MAASDDDYSEDGIWVFQETQSIQEDYSFGKQLGQPGAFGVAYLVTSTSKRASSAIAKRLACKMIKKNRIGSKAERESHFEALRGEIAVMRKLKHQNIIQLYDVYEDKENLYLVLEFCAGGELFDRISAKHHYSEKDAAFVLRQIFAGLGEMHRQKIAHCDLKPDNFLFLTEKEDSVLKIIDFGMSKFVKPHQKKKLLCGTPYYVAPEVLREEYNEACDVWSMGVVTFIMIFGFPPFNGENDEAIFQAIESGFSPVVKEGFGAYFPSKLPVSEAAKDFITRLLTKNPLKRITVAEALEHPWLGGQASSLPMEREVLKGLTKLGAHSKLRTAVSKLMVDSTLSAAEIKNLKKVFNKLDANGDGKVTMQELESAISSEPALKKGIKDLGALLAAADIDGNGSLDLNELTQIAVQQKLLSYEERLWAAFCKLDVNHDGKITAAEIRSLLPGENADELIKEADTNGDGEIDYDEFLALWQQLEQKKLPAD